MRDNSQPPLAEAQYAEGEFREDYIRIKKAFTLPLCVGVVLFPCSISAKANATCAEQLSYITNGQLPTITSDHSAWEDSSLSTHGIALATIDTVQDSKDNTPHTTSASAPWKSPWIDEYPRKIGLTYGAEVNIVGNYIWRGLYVGGPSVQASANVGYLSLIHI